MSAWLKIITVSPDVYIHVHVPTIVFKGHLQITDKRSRPNSVHYFFTVHIFKDVPLLYFTD